MSKGTWQAIFTVSVVFLLWVAAEMFIPLNWFVDYRDPSDTFWGHVVALFAIGIVSLMVFILSSIQLFMMRSKKA